MEVVYEIEYEKKVVERDIGRLSGAARKRIRVAIETKLTTRPEVYGKPLRRSLKGYRKLRVGEHRVVFRIEEKKVFVFAIGHRRDIYGYASKRAH